MKYLLGTKEYMTQVFDENGRVTPVTVLRAGPAVVTQVRDEERDSYNALQLGFGRRRVKTVTKPEHGQMKSALSAIGEDAESTAFRYLRETGKQDKETVQAYNVGDTIDVSTFEVGEKVTVVGTTKGKGFQGGVKRHGFKGAKEKTHGTKHANREVGSIGAMGVQRIFKGKKMPGRMGTNQVTVKNLEVTAVDEENNLLYLKGAVPGKTGGLLEIRDNAS